MPATHNTQSGLLFPPTVHTGPVLSVCFDESCEHVYSIGTDQQIIKVQIQSSQVSKEHVPIRLPFPAPISLFSLVCSCFLSAGALQRRTRFNQDVLPNSLQMTSQKRKLALSTCRPSQACFLTKFVLATSSSEGKYIALTLCSASKNP